MPRFHVQAAMDDLAGNIELSKALFAAEPSVVKDDCAKWQLEDARANFAIAARGAEAGLEHPGIQVDSADELAELQSGLARAEGPVVEEPADGGCYPSAQG